MEIPKMIPPNRLERMLGGAREVMERMNNVDVNSDDFRMKASTRQQNDKNIQEGSVQLMSEQDVHNAGGNIQQFPQQQYQPQQQQYQQQPQGFEPQFNQGQGQQQYQQPIIDESLIRNSKLPDSIKQAYLDNPIPQVHPSQVMGGMGGGSFTLDDVPNLVENTQQLQQQPQQQMQQQRQQRQGNSSENMIRSIVREEMSAMMEKYYGPSINETLKKKLLKELIAEGKVKVVKKKRPVRKQS